MEHDLQQAVEAHKAGRIQDAERLYRAILQAQPKHPDANHNLGVLVGSLNKPEAALPLFKTALEANPSQGRFWLSYIDALIKEKQFDNARNLLRQGQKAGLAREKVDALEAKLATSLLVQNPESPLPTKTPTFTQQRKKVSSKKEKKKNSSSNQKNLNQTRSPSQVEVNALLENYKKGQYDLAENLAKDLTKKYPYHQFSWKVLGAVFKQTGRLHDSLIANQKVVQISPNDAGAHSNLGNTLKELGRLEDAEASCKKAIAIKPDYAEAHSNLGNALIELGRLEDAEASYKKAIAIKPDYAANLSHSIASLNGLNPVRAPDAYISNLFDGYANKFESSLVGKLNYRIPTIVANFLRPLISSANLHFDILDLGCGTGLAGEALIDVAKTLVGIDLSKEMLKIAEAKNIYTRLIQDEIHHALSQERGASFDIIVSSDVFIYIGDIKVISDQVYDVLKQGGFFAYSTEALLPASNGKEDFLPDYKLNLSGRYSHSSKYLLGLIDAKRFTLHTLELTQIRLEKGQPVMGYVVIMQKKLNSSTSSE